ncbi:hypothetical protein ACJ41O_008036 [Fusarium nematophilum]
MAYSLSTSYVGESLLSGFRWHDGIDYSHGFVQYKNQEDALELGLYSVEPFSQVVRLAVDSFNTYGLGEGRPSLRLESKKAFHHGLFIADFLHMPPSQCGTWPAFWAYGANWPMGGEIDIIEGANLAYTNIMSGHTAEGCRLDPANEGLFSGERRNLDCFVGWENIGCGFNPPASDTSSYGDGFNAANGGVYAMEWDSEYIKIWHFPRGAVPADIEAKKPDPKRWGLPQALFGGSRCKVDEYYSNMRIVINTNFCGDYGERTWDKFDTCKALAPTCREYVANNPEDFANTYWDVKYIDVYSLDEAIPPVLPPVAEDPSSLGNSEPTRTPDSGNPDSPLSGSPNTANPGNPRNQTSPSSEPTTTTTLTRSSTIFITIPGQGTSSPTIRPLPVDGSGASANPDRIGDYSYIGCFGSRTGFQTFDETAQSDEMTLERCIRACRGKTYIGVFQESCYCADNLDADTRAVADESDCDRPCPGNEEQFCGGLVAQSIRSSAPESPIRRDAPSNILLTVYASLADAEEPEAPPAMGPRGPTGSGGGFPASTGILNGSQTGSPDSLQTGLPGSRQSSGLLDGLQTGSPQPGRPGGTTTITYFTVLPSNLRAIIPQETVVTLWYEQCECRHPKLIGVPMETRTVECNACGARGESTVTLTVPLAIAIPTTGGRSPQGGPPIEARPHQDRLLIKVRPPQSQSFIDVEPTQVTVVKELSQPAAAPVATPPGNLEAGPGEITTAVVPIFPQQPTTPAQPDIPGEPTTPALAVFPTPGAPDQPVVVVGAAWRVKPSIVLCVAVAVIFTTLL